MKKLNILPLLLVAPLLTGCGGSVKAPKFADKGEEVAGDKFAADFLEKSSQAAFAKEDAIGSLVMKSKSANSQEEKLVREKKAIKTTTEYSESSSEMKYDATNKLVQGLSKGSSKGTQTDINAKASGSSSTSVHVYIQEYTKGENKYVVMAEKESNMLQAVSPVTELSPVDKIFDGYIKEGIGEQGAYVVAAVAAYAAADEEEQKNYKFYEKDKVFTVEYKQVVENKEHKNSDDQVDYVVSSTTSYTAQLDLTDGAWRQKYYKEVSTKTEYKLDGTYSGEYQFAGDVFEEKTLKSEDVKADYKDIKLKAADLSGYKNDFLA